MALPWLNPWLSGFHSEAASKRAGGMVSLREAWITAVGRGTLKKIINQNEFFTDTKNRRCLDYNAF